MYQNENETYDITDAVVEKAFKILLVVCRIKGVKCDRISFSFRYYDLDATGWRSFCLDNFIGFVEQV